jgi:catechol 2,3-dioxygenase-like lactoylglutathione lyase family enzyme
MRRILFCLIVSALMLAPAMAQLLPPNDAGVTFGHIHLAVKDVDAQKAFFINVMHGKPVKNGPLELIEFPGVYIMLRKAEPTAPPAGSILNHFGFVVKDMPATLEWWKKNNLKIDPTQNPNESYVNGPDGIRIEVYGDPYIKNEVQMNHLHFYTTDTLEMQAWYAKMFGGSAGRRPSVGSINVFRLMETVLIPGTNLSLNPSKERQEPTKGRSLDHIGFEVKNLEAFTKKLEAQGVKFDVPLRQVPNSNVKIAFLTDPWGTYIELTEGLAPASHMEAGH